MIIWAPARGAPTRFYLNGPVERYVFLFTDKFIPEQEEINPAE